MARITIDKFYAEFIELKQDYSKMAVSVEGFAEDIKEIVHFIQGNGDAGAKIRLALLENEIKAMKEASKEQRKFKYSMYGAVALLLVNIVLQAIGIM